MSLFIHTSTMACALVMSDQSRENVQLGAGVEGSNFSGWREDSSGVPESCIFGGSHSCCFCVLAGKHMYTRGEQCRFCSWETRAYILLQSRLAASHPIPLNFSFCIYKMATISIHRRRWCEDR